MKRLENFLGHSLADQGLHRFQQHLNCPWMYNLACDYKILDVVEEILGPNILLWGSDFFIKNANSSNFVSWHQDSTYMGFESRPIVCNCWIALNPSIFYFHPSTKHDTFFFVDFTRHSKCFFSLFCKFISSGSIHFREGSQPHSFQNE